MAPEGADLIARIYNAAWLVRHYARGGAMHPTAALSKQRQEAIRELGLVVRHAFAVSEDFEALLTAVFDGLSKRDAPPF